MKKIILLVLVTVLIGGGCSQEPPDPVGAYMTLIDKLYKEDAALNHDIKYLVIDTSLIKNLSEEGKSQLLKELEKYDYSVLDMTFEELEKEGYIEDLYFKEGILFKIEDEPMNGNSIVMDASKWRSGLGAIGYNDLKLVFKSGTWKITKIGSSWIS